MIREPLPILIQVTVGRATTTIEPLLLRGRPDLLDHPDVVATLQAVGARYSGAFVLGVGTDADGEYIQALGCMGDPPDPGLPGLILYRRRLRTAPA